MSCAGRFAYGLPLAEAGDRAPHQTRVVGGAAWRTRRPVRRRPAGRPDSTTTSTCATRRRSTSGASVVLQVERHRALAAVVRGHRARDHARRVTGPGLLDPQHVGAEVGEHAGAVGARLQRAPGRGPAGGTAARRSRVDRCGRPAPRRRRRATAGYACQRVGVSSMRHTISSRPRNGVSTRATVNSCPA